MGKRICFIAQFPPPMHGLTKAIDTLYKSELAKEFNFEKIDIANNKKFFQTLMAIKKSKAELFYFTISQSIGGNIRDLMILKAIGSRPCLIHLHGGYYRKLVDEDMPKWQRKMNYRALKNLSGAIVLGSNLRYIFKGMLPDQKIFTVPNCVDDEYMMSDDMFERKISTIDQRQIKHVLYLSNFIRTKGYREVLEMANLEKNRKGERRFHFDFAGKFFEKEEEKFFWKYINDNKLEEYVTYHGIVSGDKKRELLRICDVFCLIASGFEGQPISILEAMGNGMVVITTDYEGIVDFVKDDVNGIVVNKENIDVNMIYNRLLSFTKYNTICTRNRSDVKDKFNQERYIDNMRYYFEVVK